MKSQIKLARAANYLSRLKTLRVNKPTTVVFVEQSQPFSHLVVLTSGPLCISKTKLHFRTLPLAAEGNTDYHSAVASTQIPLESQQVDSLSRSSGDNKTNYSIMGIIPLF